MTWRAMHQRKKRRQNYRRLMMQWERGAVRLRQAATSAAVATARLETVSTPAGAGEWLREVGVDWGVGGGHALGPITALM